MTVRPAIDAHVLVVGAGGIGCPAGWALARSGVARLTLVDPDVVELSNLPRQVLFVPGDLGRPKAPAAAAALASRCDAARGVHARLDHETAGALLRDVDVVIDATDGARTKDWLNQLAVRRGVPLVHAAGLRSEARLLAVPAGGRPCLACLFGRLEEETGSCADLGVWNGVVGAIGLLAARSALALLGTPRQAGPGYHVLDLQAGRHMVLGAASDPSCPVCAQRGHEEPYPEPAACAAPEEGADVVPPVREVLDLRGKRCPLNLLWARRALDAARPGDEVDIHLGQEGAATVPDGMRALGHAIVLSEPRGKGLFLRVRAGTRGKATPSARLDEHALQRFARQVVLPEVGEAGQRRLLDASVHLAGCGAAFEVAALYLAAAGVGRLLLGATPGELAAEIRSRALGTVEVHARGVPPHVDLRAWAGGPAPPEPALAAEDAVALVACEEGGALSIREDARHPLVVPGGHTDPVLGALLADAVQRRIVTGRTPLAGVALDGRLAQNGGRLSA